MKYLFFFRSATLGIRKPVMNNMLLATARYRKMPCQQADEGCSHGDVEALLTWLIFPG